ncbi:MAG: 7-carboxy-7-deazaguanine synthase QueE [Lentisphaeria bacterium]|nr:7-carboxy-7-deazaguanine synthase QueE [Lentisphaeria bacterium]
MSDSTLYITEFFASLQGEGPLMGQPATFVRLSGCIKPYCHFCDTTFSFAKGTAWSPKNLAQKVLSFNQKLIVITGGEPFLQWETGLEEFENLLLDAGVKVQYETSGRVKLPAKRVGVTMICSPKQVGKFDTDEWSFVPNNVGCVDYFKFVYSNNQAQITRFVTEYEIQDEKIYIMPEGAGIEGQMERMAEAWDFCVKMNWNLGPRLHVLAFDTKTGV